MRISQKYRTPVTGSRGQVVLLAREIADDETGNEAFGHGAEHDAHDLRPGFGRRDQGGESVKNAEHAAKQEAEENLVHVARGKMLATPVDELLLGMRGRCH